MWRHGTTFLFYEQQLYIVHSWSHSPMDELQPTVAETLKFVSISMCDVCDCVFAEQSCGISIFLHEPIPIVVTLDHQVVALSSPRSYAWPLRLTSVNFTSDLTTVFELSPQQSTESFYSCIIDSWICIIPPGDGRVSMCLWFIVVIAPIDYGA